MGCLFCFGSSPLPKRRHPPKEGEAVRECVVEKSHKYPPDCNMTYLSFTSTLTKFIIRRNCTTLNK